LRAGKAEAFLQSSFNERAPAFSPDGRWLAYSSDETGSLQVYVRAFPDGSGKIQISSGGGNFPVWSPNGRELFLQNLDPDNRLMVATYTVQGDSFRPDKARLWSDKKLPFLPPTRSFDVAPDSQRIVAIMPADAAQEQKAQQRLVFLFNFFDELRRRVPTGGEPIH
jgi:hypothetical protein